MRTFVTIFCFLSISSTAFAFVDLASAIKCVKGTDCSNVSPDTRKQIYDLVMAQVFQVVGSFESTEEQNSEAVKLADEASSFLIAPILKR
jgi:hypothetical protein